MRCLFLLLIVCFVSTPALAKSKLASHHHATKRPAVSRLTLEAWIADKIKNGSDVDLVQFCASVGDSKGAPCAASVPAALVARVLQNASASPQNLTHSITFRHATILGDLDISGASVARGVAFIDSRFLGKVGLRNCSFTKDLMFEHTSFDAGLSAAGLKVGGDLIFAGHGDFKGQDVDLVNADIALGLYVSDVFADEGVKFNAAGAKVHAGVKVAHAHFFSGWRSRTL